MPKVPISLIFADGVVDLKVRAGELYDALAERAGIPRHVVEKLKALGALHARAQNTFYLSLFDGIQAAFACVIRISRLCVHPDMGIQGLPPAPQTQCLCCGVGDSSHVVVVGGLCHRGRT